MKHYHPLSVFCYRLPSIGVAVRGGLLSSLCLLVTFQASGSDSVWIGDLSKTAERATTNGRYSQCNRISMIRGQDVVFDDWDLSRAMVANLCFRVYQEGVTDQAEPSPGDLNVRLLYSKAASATGDIGTTPVSDVTVYPARYVGREGNNFVYAISAFEFMPVSGRALNGNTSRFLHFSIEAINVGTGRGYGFTGPFQMKLCPGRPESCQ